MFYIECSAITYIGEVRNNNEDNYYVNGKFKSDSSVSTEGYFDNNQRDSYLYAVCDGMGGEKNGARASLIAVAALTRYQSTDIRRTVRDYIHVTNHLICEEIEKNGGARSGTTLALLYIRDGRAISYNIGDSRIYFYRDGCLYLMSEDHTEAQRLVKMGIINDEDAKHHKSRNTLTQHLGIFPDELVIEPYTSEEVELMRGDMFLICSDGLTEMVDDDEIAAILSHDDMDSTGMTRKLASAVQSYGAKDNATVIVVRVD